LVDRVQRGDRPESLSDGRFIANTACRTWTRFWERKTWKCVHPSKSCAEIAESFGAMARCVWSVPIHVTSSARV